MAGAIILTMSVSGVLLAYQRQIIAWSNRDHRVSPPPGKVDRLPAGDLLSRVQREVGALPGTLLLRSDRQTPAEAGYGRDRITLVNPYTGAIVGESSPRVRAFFRSTEEWHRWLGSLGGSSSPMRTVTGFCNLLFLVLLLSGLVLWFPRAWTWKKVRPSVLFQPGLRGRARNWNWHNTAGFWAAVPLSAIVFSGVVMSFGWANDLVYRLTGSEVPTRPAERLRENRSRPLTSLKEMNSLWARTEQLSPGWRSISLRVPVSAAAPVVFTVDVGNGGRPDLRSQLVLDPETAEVIRWETFGANSPGRKFRMWLRFIHTGEAGGLIGQTVAALASLGAALLVWTGFAMALRRWSKWRRARAALV